MKVLIKLGGTLLDKPESLSTLAHQIAHAADQYQLAVVHGGGKQVTSYLSERGVESRFVGGLRISDGAVIEAVINVIAGGINKRLVSAIIAAGRPAVGISGIDGSLTQARQLCPQLQFVGQPEGTDGRLLDLLANAAYTPVIACVAGSKSGQIFNVNADTMAVSCAIGWRASRLLFLTDVGGVRNAQGEWLPDITLASARHLIATGVAHGGMQAKLEAAGRAVDAEIDVTIAHGLEPDVIPRLLAGERLGTHWASLPHGSEQNSALRQSQ